MNRILVIDEQEIYRVPMAAWLRQEGYEAAAAANGLEAVSQLRGSKVDLILFDFAMRNEDGSALLSRLRSEPRWRAVPIIVLTSVAEKQQVLAAAKLGIRDYILKSRFSLDEMQARIKRLLQTASAPAERAPAAPSAGPDAVAAPGATAAAAVDLTSLPVLMSRKQCMDRAKSAMKPQGMAGIVAQVITMAASRRGDAVQLAEMISRDPMLTARILRAANSAYYSTGRGPVTSVPQAVRQVGATSVRNIAAAMGIYDAMPVGDESGFNSIRCWQHSFAVATLCEQLFGEEPGVDPGIPYLVGLCHDLGEIMFQTCFGPEYTQVLGAATRVDKPIAEIEMAMLGMTHGDLAQMTFELMGLPESIRTPILAMHDVAIGKSRSRLASALRLADMYANGLLLSSSGRELLVAITQEECRGITGQPHPPIPDGQRFRSEIFALTSMLGRLSAADEEKFLRPMYPNAKRPVLLVRDPGLSRFDPMAAAAQALSDVKVVEELPDAVADQPMIIVARSAETAGFTPDLIARAADPSRTLWLTRKPGSQTSAAAAPAGDSFRPTFMPITIDALAAFVCKGSVEAASRPAVAA